MIRMCFVLYIYRLYVCIVVYCVVMVVVVVAVVCGCIQNVTVHLLISNDRINTGKNITFDVGILNAFCLNRVKIEKEREIKSMKAGLITKGTERNSNCAKLCIDNTRAYSYLNIGYVLGNTTIE